MALSELKQTEAELKEYGVQSAPDKLEGAAADNKKIFDRLFQNVGMHKFNLLLDYLMDGTVAEELGIQYIPELGDVETLQAALERLVEIVGEVTQGAVLNGSITTPKLADGSVTGPKVALRAIAGPMIALLAIGGEHLRDGCILPPHLSTGCVTKDKLDPRVTAEALGGVKLRTGSGFIMVDDWDTSTTPISATVSAPNVTATNHVILDAADDASGYYMADYGVRVFSQGVSRLTFHCRAVPSGTVSVKYLTLEV